MSGHNKWSKIKHKKAFSDAKRSKEFGRLGQILKVEARAASGDVNSAGLRAAIEKAKAANMPKENIERAIARATGAGAAALESATYEAYGPGGCAIIIETRTDNKNRTAAEVKHALSQQEIELASPGAAAWAFSKSGDTWTPNQTSPISKEDKKKLENLVETLEGLDDVESVYTNAE